MRRILSIFIVFLSTTSCGVTNRYTELSNHIINEHSQYDVNKNWDLIATGGSSTQERVFILKYWINERVGVDEARKMFVESVDKFVNRLNANLEIRPYLPNFPAGREVVEISLAFLDPMTHIRFGNGDVTLVFEANGTLYYCTDENGDLVDLFKEPYEDAIRIVYEKK